jgi:hypothetical protein
MKAIHRVGRKRIPPEIKRERERAAFIEKMKKSPELWGNIKCGGKGFCISVGSVCIYNIFHERVRRLSFHGAAWKLEQLNYAAAQIKHLKNYYIEIHYVNTSNGN